MKKLCALILAVVMVLTVTPMIGVANGISDERATFGVYYDTDKTYIVPEEMNGHPVTKIDATAFFHNKLLERVILPDSVNEIGWGAFANCESLTAVTMPQSMKSLGYRAFYNCGSLINVTIPAGLTEIEESTFFDCLSLTSLIIPEGVSKISEYAFSGCESLVSLSIPESVVEIDNTAFNYCENLTIYCVENSYAHIYAQENDISYSFGVMPYYVAFYTDGGFSVPPFADITSGSLIDAPQEPYKTGYSFVGWYKDAELEEAWDFEFDTVTENIMLYAKWEEGTIGSEGEYDYMAVNGEAAVIGYHGSGGDIVIPDTLGGDPVTAIGDSVFVKRMLGDVTIPESVTVIGKYAFYCSGLTSVNIPEDVTVIGDYAFSECMLTDITLPLGITEIGASVFSGCTLLTEVVIPEGVTSIDTFAFQSCEKLESVTLPDSLVKIGNTAFSGCRKLNNVALPEDLKKIGFYAFACCESLDEITIPDGIISIGEGAFYACISLPGISVGENNEYYTEDEGILFDKDKESIIQYPAGKNDEEYIIPGNEDDFPIAGYTMRAKSSTSEKPITSIAPFAFAGAEKLKSLTIPNSVTVIGKNAFMDCKNLTLYCKEGSAAHTYADNNNIRYSFDNLPIDNDNTKKYTVTYNANGAISGAVPVDSTEYQTGDEISVLGNPDNLSGGTSPRGGDLRFMGWTLEPDKGTVYRQGEKITMGNANITLYAKWSEIIVETYSTVKFNKNGGDTEANPNFIRRMGHPVTINVPKPPKRQGYSFSGWNTKPDGTGEVYTGKLPLPRNSDITVYAQWKPANAAIPKITAQPKKKTLKRTSKYTLTVNAKAAALQKRSSKLTYQWYSNKNNRTKGGKKVRKATAASFKVPTTKKGTMYYYCVITNRDNKAAGKKTATVTSKVAKIIIK